MVDVRAYTYEVGVCVRVLGSTEMLHIKAKEPMSPLQPLPVWMVEHDVHAKTLVFTGKMRVSHFQIDPVAWHSHVLRLNPLALPATLFPHENLYHRRYRPIERLSHYRRLLRRIHKTNTAAINTMSTLTTLSLLSLLCRHSSHCQTQFANSNP